MNLSPKTTCIERSYVFGQWGGLSRQIPLYLIWFSHGVGPVHCNQEKNNGNGIKTDCIRNFPSQDESIFNVIDENDESLLLEPVTCQGITGSFTTNKNPTRVPVSFFLTYYLSTRSSQRPCTAFLIFLFLIPIPHTKKVLLKKKISAACLRHRRCMSAAQVCLLSQGETRLHKSRK